MTIPTEQITAGILAGGEGRRLGGIDKGWYAVGGRPLIVRTLERVQPQVGSVLISANRSLSRYRRLGHAVHGDASDDYRGPLAGIAAVLEAAATPYVLIVPVDTPLLPLDLAARLGAVMTPATDIVVARTPGGLHPLHALLRRSLLHDLQVALAFGVRRVTEWQEGSARLLVDWADDAGFDNINSQDQARALERTLGR